MFVVGLRRILSREVRCVPPPLVVPSASAIVDHALATIAEQQSTWRPAELTRELAASTSTSIATTADALARWLDELTNHTVAA